MSEQQAKKPLSFTVVMAWLCIGGGMLTAWWKGDYASGAFSIAIALVILLIEKDVI